MATELKLVNGVGVQVEKAEPPKGTHYAEVRVRHFYTSDESGMIIMPTVVYFIKDGVAEKDTDIVKLGEKLRNDIAGQLPFPIRCMTEEEIATELSKEISVGSLVASQGKASISVFAKNMKDEETATVAPPTEPTVVT